MGRFERPEFGANVGLIDEIYRQYLDNPESVSPAWRDFFAENEPDGGQAAEAATPPTPQEAPPAREPARAEPEARPKPQPKAEEQPKPKPASPAPAPAPTPERDGKEEAQVVPLRGAAARIVPAMEASRGGAAAHAGRAVPGRLLG